MLSHSARGWRGWLDMFPLKPPRLDPSLPLLASGNPRWPLAYNCISLIPTYIFPWPPFLCVSVSKFSPSYRDANLIGQQTQPTPVVQWHHWTQLMTPAMILFPNKVVFEVLWTKALSYLLRGHNSTCNTRSESSPEGRQAEGISMSQKVPSPSGAYLQPPLTHHSPFHNSKTDWGSGWTEKTVWTEEVYSRFFLIRSCHPCWGSLPNLIPTHF